jgi:thiol-disulfide isomerase/thioredoxin
MFKIIVLIVLLFANSTSSNAQNTKRIGGILKVCSLFPNFVLNNVEHFSKSQVSLKDFRGKWLVLDFWNEYCSACVASFPKTNELQKEFADKLQFLLVGYSAADYHFKRSGGSNIRKLYEKVRQKNHIVLPVAYDSMLFRKFKITSCPFIIIVDPKGIVRGITYTLNRDNVIDLLSGKPVIFTKVYNLDQKTEIFYDPDKPFLTNGNGGADSDFSFRSLLSKWNSSMACYNPVKISVGKNKGRFETLKIDIANLYRLAYFGEYLWSSEDSLYGEVCQTIIYETVDSLLFEGDYATGKNLYCYSLSIPLPISSVNKLMNIMQGDLKNYFGYTVNIEMTKMPYWKLTATEKAKQKLRTKGDTNYLTIIPNQGFIAKGISVRDLIRMIWASNQNEPPLFDETGIYGKIDLSIDCIMTDLSDLNKALLANGLNLVRGEKQMKVLVIRDSKSETKVLSNISE